LSYRYRRANEPTGQSCARQQSAGTGFGFMTTGLFTMRNSCWVVLPWCCCAVTWMVGRGQRLTARQQIAEWVTARQTSTATQKRVYREASVLQPRNGRRVVPFGRVNYRCVDDRVLKAMVFPRTCSAALLRPARRHRSHVCRAREHGTSCWSGRRAS
jgi:hypothetical protein